MLVLITRWCWCWFWSGTHVVLTFCTLLTCSCHHPQRLEFMSTQGKEFTNVFVKNFGEDVTEETFTEIVSVMVVSPVCCF